MGNFRDTPDKTKDTLAAKTDRLGYACTSMCGWRLFMEDAHIVSAPFANDPNLALFAIFDGHGGI